MKKIIMLFTLILGLTFIFYGCNEENTPEEPIKEDPPVEVTLQSIALKEKGKDTYYVGDTFDVTGYTCLVTYSDGTTKDIVVTTSMVEVSLATVGTITGNISYTEDDITKTTTFTITVEEKVVPISLSVKEYGKIVYTYEMTLDLSEYVFEIEYSNGVKKTITLDNNAADITSFVENGTDDTQYVDITVTYVCEGVTLATTIQVENLSEWCYEEYIKPLEEAELVQEIIDRVTETIPTEVDSESEDIVLLSNNDINTYKIILSWNTSNGVVIGTNGAITPGEDDEVVTLTLLIKCTYNENKTIEFPINVKGLGPVIFPTFNSEEKHVFAYFYEGTYREISSYAANKIDVLNYCFAQIGSDCKVDVSGLGYLSQVLAWRREYKMRVVLCIGGGGAGIDDTFTNACTDPANRKIFIDSIIETLNKYKFDGIDIDWEYPTKYTEVELFTTFIKELREAMDAYKDGLLLTAALIAGGSVSNVKEYYDCVELNKYLDYAHLMTYDLNSAGTASHNSNPLAGRAYSVESSIGYYHTSGFDYNKIVIGAAFYGKISELTTPTTATSAVLNKAVISTSSITYKSIVANYLNNDEYKLLYDSACGAYYLTNGINFITFENRESIDLKGQLVKNYGLGGMMFWDYGSDTDTNTLLGAVATAIYAANH